MLLADAAAVGFVVGSSLRVPASSRGPARQPVPDPRTVFAVLILTVDDCAACRIKMTVADPRSIVVPQLALVLGGRATRGGDGGQE